MVTTRLRLGTFVLNADIRDPALLAQDLATLDLLSDGRLEVGLGAGWMRADYEALGQDFRSPSARLARLKAAVRQIRDALEHGRLRHEGEGEGSEGFAFPQAVQRPHPPILLGGGGPQLLTFAADEADIVSINPRSTRQGALDPGDVSAAAMDEKVALVRSRAAERWPSIELNANLLGVGVSRANAHGPARALVADMTDEQIAASPHFLPADPGEMVEVLHARRERWSLSYVVVRQAELAQMDVAVKRLAGT
jgi:probable F420-dependent oxidoreductase